MTDHTVPISAESSSTTLSILFGAGQTGPRCIGSRSPTGIEGARYILALTGPSDLRAADLDGQAFGVLDWLVHEISLVDAASGDERSALRLVLCDERGQTLSCVSDIAIRDWATVVEACGPGPYEPVIPIRIVARKTRAGRTMYTLRLA